VCFGHEKYLSSQFNEPELLAMGNSTRGDAGDEANSARQHTHRASLRSLSISVMLNGFLSDLMAAVEAASSKFNALNPAAREIRPDDDVTVTEFGSTLRLNLSVDENFRVSKQDGEGERKKLITGHKYAMQQPQKTEQSEASTPLPRRRGWGARNHISHRKKRASETRRNSSLRQIISLCASSLEGNPRLPPLLGRPQTERRGKMQKFHS
jgi:hypothetical protein